MDESRIDTVLGQAFDWFWDVCERQGAPEDLGAIQAEVKRRCDAAPKLEALLAECRTAVEHFFKDNDDGPQGFDDGTIVMNAEDVALLRALLARLAAPAGLEARDG